jgi:hypothetical protein
VVLFSSELLIDESIAGVITGLLKSEVALFEVIGLGLIRGSSKSEPSLPIRGSTSEFVRALRVLLVVRALVLTEGMLLISEALLIIKVSASVGLNSEAGPLAGSIKFKLSCSGLDDSAGV